MFLNPLEHPSKEDSSPLYLYFPLALNLCLWYNWDPGSSLIIPNQTEAMFDCFFRNIPVNKKGTDYIIWLVLNNRTGEILARVIGFISFEQITLGLLVSEPALVRQVLSCIKETCSTLHKTFPLKIHLAMGVNGLLDSIHQQWQDLPNISEWSSKQKRKVGYFDPSRLLDSHFC